MVNIPYIEHYGFGDIPSFHGFGGLENSEIVRLRRWVPAMVHCLAGGAQGEMGWISEDAASLEMFKPFSEVYKQKWLRKYRLFEVLLRMLLLLVQCLLVEADVGPSNILRHWDYLAKLQFRVEMVM